MSRSPSASCEAYVGLGSNLADPVAQVTSTFDALDRIEDTHLLARSSLYRSRPVGYAEQPDFVNAVAQLATRLSAADLLRELLALEQAHGRMRGIPNGPRTLDLDLLLYGDQRIEAKDLSVPHPRMHERAFVLVPLHEIAPLANIPGRGTVANFLSGVDTRGVERLGHG